MDLVRVLGILQRLSLCYGLMLLCHYATGYGSVRRRKFLALFMFILYIVYFTLMVSFDGAN